MPTHAGPNIVEDGLVLALDAADRNSYPINGLDIEYLIVAGGGGGGGGESNVNGGGGGGGGAGGVLFGKKNVDFSNFTITVGGGGSGGSTSNSGTDGSNSSAFGLTSFGGGGGGGDEREGRTGGSGGGSGGDEEGSGGSSTSSQGFPGGKDVGSSRVGGGGGGAGGAGFDGTDSNGKEDGSNGGVGLYFGDKFGNNYGENGWFAGGGAGGGNQGFVNQVPNAGLGGIGGGGHSDGIRDGSNKNSTSGQANTGGGGGAGRASKIGRSGGSGIVLIRYKGSQKAKGGIVTEKDGYTIHAFTASGTFEVGRFIGSIVDNSSGELKNGVSSITDNLGILDFDGVDDFIIISNTNLPAPANNLTLECLFQRNSGRTIINYGPSSTNASKYYCFEITTTKLKSVIFTTTYTILSSITDINSNTWYHAVMTYDGSSMKFYINGVLESSTSTSGNISNNLNPSLNIGRKNSGSGEYINGKIAKVKLYNRALTPEEIQQNYNATKSRFGL